MQSNLLYYTFPSFLRNKRNPAPKETLLAQHNVEFHCNKQTISLLLPWLGPEALLLNLFASSETISSQDLFRKFHFFLCNMILNLRKMDF